VALSWYPLSWIALTIVLAKTCVRVAIVAGNTNHGTNAAATIAAFFVVVSEKTNHVVIADASMAQLVVQ
jgi:hypothetical protein